MNQMDQEMENPSSSDPWLTILDKLEAAKPLLSEAGNVYARRRGSNIAWVVRYPDKTGGKARLRSIYVGSRDYARRTKRVIDNWQSETRAKKRRQRMVMLAVKLRTSTLGYSGRARRRILAETKAAMGDPRSLIPFAYGYVPADPAPSHGRSGRPRKARIWSPGPEEEGWKRDFNKFFRPVR